METWLSDMMPLAPFTLSSGNTGGFETWLSDSTPLPDYVKAAATSSDFVPLIVIARRRLMTIDIWR